MAAAVPGSGTRAATGAAAPSTAAAAAAAADDDDDVVALGDFFVCRAYETKTYTFGDVSQRVDALSAASTDVDLTGQIVWLVSQLVSWWVVAAGEAGGLAGSNVLELGAGAGLPGLLAAQYAARVVLTDYEEEILALLARNVESHTPPACATSAVSLAWGVDADAARVLGDPATKFDLLLGADVVYWSASITPLIASVASLLAPRGQFILGYFNRVDSNRVRPSVCGACRRRGS